MHVDRSEVMCQRQIAADNPGLEPTKIGVVGDDLLEQLHSTLENDGAVIVVGHLRLLDHGKTLADRSCVGDDLPDVIRRAVDQYSCPNRCHFISFLGAPLCDVFGHDE